MQELKHLSERTAHLLLEGARTSGNFTDGYFYIEGSLYADEANEVYEFCKFIDEIGGAGPANINIFWLGFKYPNNKMIMEVFNEKKQEIVELNKRIKSWEEAI